MNERIAELYNRAIVIDNGGDYVTGELDPTKFAELIVGECIEWCDAHATIDGTAQQVRDSIKNHFGIK